MRNKDILPNTNMSRDNFNLRVNTSAGPVDFDFTANYTREKVKNRPALGDSKSNVGKNLMTLAGTYDQAWLKHYEDADGNYDLEAERPDNWQEGSNKYKHIQRFLPHLFLVAAWFSAQSPGMVEIEPVDIRHQL